MPRLSRLLLAAVLLAAGLLAVARGDTATSDPLPQIEPREVLRATVGTSGTLAGACHTAVRDGTRGVASRTVAVSGAGPVDVALDAGSGDWDVAVFDSRGRLIAAGASADGHEIASGWVLGADTLRVQACRRSGGASSARVVVEHGTIPAELIESAKGQRLQAVSVSTPTRAEKDRLAALGLDMTEHGGRAELGVILHGTADERTLRDAGFTFRVLEDDLVARSIQERTADRRYAARTRRSPLPSGRDTYRQLADYENEMKTLAQQNPGLVRLFTMPEKTWLGREVLGIEIATDVNLKDGRPAFLNMGVHHAREWPSGEHAMEWAYELINGYKAGDERATKIVRGSRNIVVPIVNPDGFNASRTAGELAGAGDGRDEAVPDTAYIVSGAAWGGEYRRKNCRVADTTEGNCGTSAGLAELGTDPNRNYGGLWGGPGAERNHATQTYPGPSPFSEPETRNVKWLVSNNQVMTLITNHTTAGLVLRAPGLAFLGDPVDEHRGYKALGDAMAMENGYFSQKSWELYDTTGTTEDWSYNGTGGFGFTFEIYCGAPNYTTGNCDDPAFHPFFATMVKEWDGSSPQSDHANDPGRSESAPFGMQDGYDGRGNREAYYIAAESTLNERRHSVLEGDAPGGAVLRLTKEFKTETYPQPQGEGQAPIPLVFQDKLETTYDVPQSGKFRWHVNPSTRPIAEKDRGRDPRGTPSPPQDIAPTTVTAPCTPLLLCQWGNDDQEFTVPTGEGVDNGKVRIRINWITPGSDYDLKVFRPGASPISQDALATSAQRGTNSEEVMILEPAGTYLIRVVNVAAAEPWTGTINYELPDPFKEGITETWTLSCEVDGKVLQTSQVFIARGEVRRPDLGVCDRRARELRGGATETPGAVPGPGTSPGCVAPRGFRSAGVRPRGGGLRFSFARRIDRPVTVAVFQQSIGRQITGERLVARFTGRRRSFTWDGRANRPGREVRDGYLFARFAMRTPDGLDVRRVTLRRSNGRLARRGSFHRRQPCGTLMTFKTERPVFGGPTNRALNVSYRLSEEARVEVEVLRGRRVVRRFGPGARRALMTHRARVKAENLSRGDYRVRITAIGESGRRVVATLVARRL